MVVEILRKWMSKSIPVKKNCSIPTRKYTKLNFKSRIMAESNKTENKKVRVAIIGVGNCASSLVQGVHYYRNSKEDDRVPGLMHVNLGGYHIRDIEFSAAIDVVDTKVGLDLAEAIYAYPNNTYKFADVPKIGVKVSRGMTHDGLGKYLSQVVKKAPGPTDDIINLLRKQRQML